MPMMRSPKQSGSRNDEQAADNGFESVIHGAYFAMFHAARAALLAVQGTASTNHGRCSHLRADGERRIWHTGERLAEVCAICMRMRYGTEDLTEQGQALRAQMRPFLALCAGLVAERARA